LKRQIVCLKIQDLLGQGFSIASIRKVISPLGYSSIAAQNKIIRDAVEQATEGTDRQAIRDVNHQRIEAIIEKEMRAGQTKEALKAIDIQNKMAGVYIEKKEVTINEVYDIQF
jgi:hypothetical protein